MSRRETRPLTRADVEQTIALGREAFGEPPPGTPPLDPAAFPRPGTHSWGTFEDGRLVTKVVEREYHSWWGGAQVATHGVAGVAVAAEHRGGGHLLPLFREVLAAGLRERGEAVSTLYPTAPGIYRGLGYELVTSLDTVEVPAAALARVRAPEGVTLRRATVDDVPALRAAYDRWAARQHGPLVRRGPSWPATDAELLAEVTGTTLALGRDEEVLGYAAWRRGRGYDDAAVLEVDDLVVRHADAARALWPFLGSFASVVGRVRLQTSGTDAARLVLPTAHWAVVGSHPYMLRVHDLVEAVRARALTDLPVPDAAVALAVAGDRLGTLDGGYVLGVSDGAVTCARAGVQEGAGAGALRLTPQGLALLWAGAWSVGALREAGLVAGGREADDALLDAVWSAGARGAALHVRDYF